MQSMRIKIFLALFILILIYPSSLFALNCSSAPSGFGGSWARAYKNWCESCGGTYSSSGPSCIPGPNWGGRGGGGGSYSAPPYDYEAERQRQEAESQRQLEAERQRQQEIEEQRRKEDEEAKRRQEEFNRNKQEALKSMKGITENELGLKGSPSEGLGLKGISDDKLGLKEAASFDTDNLTKKKGAAKIPVGKEKQQSAPLQKGLRDASQCFESNAQVYCLSVPANEQNKCIESYTAGFNSGMEYQNTILNGAFIYGKQDKEEGKKNQSFNNPNAKGPCRVKWIESYNRGYFGGKAPKNNKQ